MSLPPRAVRRLALFLPAALVAIQPVLAPPAAARTIAAKPGAEPAAPRYLQTGEETPWIYRGSDVPPEQTRAVADYLDRAIRSIV